MTDTPTLAALARPSGTFAMVAMDQRESLRTMFRAAASGTTGGGGAGATHGTPDDDVLVRFKLDVARALAPVASAFLIDRELGFDQVRAEGLVPAGTGLILAADALQQEPGGPVEDTDLDEVVVAPDFDLTGVHALKLLLVWRRDARREWRVDLAERFIAAARARGVLSVLEPVVRPTPDEEAGGGWDADAAAREAARELSPLGASLYKVQVPGAGRGTPDEQRAASERLGRDTTGPWVVLSQGVALEHFAGAVEAACRAGASGFLAGRAVWSDVVGAADVPARLRAVSVPRLERLVEIVDREARPWAAA